MQIGFVTSTEDPSLTADDLLAVDELKRRGIIVQPMIWDETEFDSPSSTSLGAIIFRSCWDYHLKRDAFVRFLKGLKSSKIPVWNSPEVLLWNLNKRHLLDYQRNGFPVPETYFFDQGTQIDLSSIDSSIKQLVLKPAVSLNGYDTYAVDRTDKEKIETYSRSILAKSDLIAQEYFPEIKSTGELSFVFFNGEFSHAVRKLPKSGEFRIHEAYGGTRQAIDATDNQIRQAKSLLELVPDETLYTRVDVVDRNGNLFLIEIEALDPSLYFGNDPASITRFCDALEARLL